MTPGRKAANMLPDGTAVRCLHGAGLGVGLRFIARPKAAVRRRLGAARGALTSEERRARRRARRDEKRARNRAARIAGCTLEAVADADELLRCANDCASGIRWKSSVQRYMGNAVTNVMRSRADVLAGRDVRKGFVCFDLFERGKRRHITAVHFSERVVQKSLTRNALALAIWPSMTPGCSANMPGRGTDLAVSRLKRQLAAHHRRHGAEGYVLLIDFKDYFGSIDHEACRRMVDKALDDERVIRLVHRQIDSLPGKGLGLGSEPNQIMAVALPSPIDHLLERAPAVEFSGRYMDDTYAIGTDKGALFAVLEDVRRECAKLGITVNERKTRVVKLTRGFVYLKKRFFYGSNGKVVVRPCRESVTRMRRKLRKFAAMVERGEMTYEQAAQSYQSWRGSMARLDAHKTLLSTDALFRERFKGLEG